MHRKHKKMTIYIISTMILSGMAFWMGTFITRSQKNANPISIINPSETGLWSLSRNKWDTLPQASQFFKNELKSAMFINSRGELVRLSLKKPILFSAPWCIFCAKNEKMFEKYGYLRDVTIIGVALKGTESGLKPIGNENTLHDAIETFNRDWKYYGINYPVNKVLFSLSKNRLNKTLHTFPIIVIPHGGNFYVQIGYQPAFSFWSKIFGGTENRG